MNLAIAAEERHHFIRRDISKITVHFDDSDKLQFVKQTLLSELKHITPSYRVEKFGSTVASLSRQFDNYKITFKTDYSNAHASNLEYLKKYEFLTW
jgi:hypothetical protein